MLNAAVVGGGASNDLGPGEQAGFFADGNEPDARSDGHGATENEAARLDARNLRRGSAHGHACKMLHDGSEHVSVAEQSPHIRVTVDPTECGENSVPHK